MVYLVRLWKAVPLSVVADDKFAKDAIVVIVDAPVLRGRGSR